MAMFEWSDTMSVNVKEFDSQHKQLIAILNELAEAISHGKGNEVVGRSLDKVIAYTQTHFAAEERKMKAHAFPQFDLHKAEHDKLVAQAGELKKKMAGGTAPTVQTMQFLKEWLLNHIQKTDKVYGQFFASKGIS